MPDYEKMGFTKPADWPTPTRDNTEVTYPIRPYFATAETENLREPIVKLGTMITDRALQKLHVKKITGEDPEYWALSKIVTDEEAEVALTMGCRQPKFIEEIQALNPQHTPEHLQELLDHMSWTGIVEWNNENLDG